MEENQVFQFDLLDILKGLYEGKILIIAMTVLLAVCFGVYSHYNTVYTYTADGTIYISNVNTEINNNVIEGGDISTSRSLVSSYTEILKSRSFLNEINDVLGGNLSAGALRGMIGIYQIEGTEFITITATSGSAQLSHDIVSAVIERAPAKLLSVYDGGTIRTLDEATFPTSPNARGTTKDVMTGAALGFVISAAFLIIRRILDRRIRTVADIEKRYEISILGELPLI